MTVWVSAKSFSRKRAHQWSLWDAVNRAFWRTVVISSWRSRLVHYSGWYCRNRCAWPGKDGVWVWWCGIGTQCKNFDSRPSRSLLRAMPHRSSLYDSHTPWVTFPLREPWVRVQEEDPMHLLFQVESPLLFTARCHAGTSFQLWCSGLGIPAWGWDSHDFQGGLLQPRYSSSFSAYACGYWG